MDLSELDVVVVDDDCDACQLIKRILEGQRARVRTALSAEEGFSLISEEIPHLLISDIGMPNEDGYQFLRRVRKLPPAVGGTVPTIALTAFARSEDRAQTAQAGFQSHLVKPVEASELLSVVALLTGRKAPHSVRPGI